MKAKDLETVIYQMVSRQNAMMIHKILPTLERLQDGLAHLRREQGLRLDQVEAAVGDLAGELLTLKNQAGQKSDRKEAA